MSKTIVQQTFDTPKGVMIFTPKTQPTYLQTKVVELHWAGYSNSEICEIHNVDTDFVDVAIQEYSA